MGLEEDGEWPVEAEAADGRGDVRFDDEGFAGFLCDPPMVLDVVVFVAEELPISVIVVRVSCVMNGTRQLDREEALLYRSTSC